MLQLNCYKLLLLQNLWSVVNNRFLVVLSLCTVYWLVGLECTQLQHAWDKNCSLEIFGLQCKSYSYCLRNIVETQNISAVSAQSKPHFQLVESSLNSCCDFYLWRIITWCIFPLCSLLHHKRSLSRVCSFYIQDSHKTFWWSSQTTSCK